MPGPTGPQGIQGIQDRKEGRAHWPSGCTRNSRAGRTRRSHWTSGCARNSRAGRTRTYWASRCARDSGWKAPGPTGDCDCPPDLLDEPTDRANQPACNFLVYATNAGLIDDPTNDTVSVINTGTNIVVDTITVGNAPLEVTVSPNGARAYVTNIFLIPFPLLILLRILLSLPFLLELIQ